MKITYIMINILLNKNEFLVNAIFIQFYVEYLDGRYRTKWRRLVFITNQMTVATIVPCASRVRCAWSAGNVRMNHGVNMNDIRRTARSLWASIHKTFP